MARVSRDAKQYAENVPLGEGWHPQARAFLAEAFSAGEKFEAQRTKKIARMASGKETRA
jgi:hypothetical protein